LEARLWLEDVTDTDAPVKEDGPLSKRYHIYRLLRFGYFQGGAFRPNGDDSIPASIDSENKPRSLDLIKSQEERCNSIKWR